MIKVNSKNLIAEKEKIKTAIKSYKGVNVHNGSLRISFMLPKSHSPKKVSLRMPPTLRNVEIAARTLANIKEDIRAGFYENNKDEFWARHFRFDVVRDGKPLTLKELVAEYSEANKGNLSDSVKSKIQTMENWLTKHEFDQKPIKQLTTKAIDKIRRETVSGNKKGAFEGCAVSTVNEYSQTLNRVLEFAVKRKYIKENPMSSVQRLAKDDYKLSREDKVVRPFTSAELNSVLAAINVRKTRLMATFLAWTGLRPRDESASVGRCRYGKEKDNN